MASFHQGNSLNNEIEKIFEDAKDFIIIISPFIKLHDRLKSTLRSKKDFDQLAIIVVFGKNEDNLSKSISEYDLNFFTAFPNIEIRYEKRLHAKYYANEFKSLLSSMNLYSYSQDNNIEAGILFERTLIGSNKLDNDAYKYFDTVIKDSELLFKKSPQYSTSLMGLKTSYTESIIEVNHLSNFNFESTNKPRANSEKHIDGFCIRTGVKIPFNIEKPLSEEAYRFWSKYGDKNFPEKYCHFSGEPSNGETSFSKPILAKNWKKAKEQHHF